MANVLFTHDRRIVVHFQAYEVNWTSIGTEHKWSIIGPGLSPTSVRAANYTYSSNTHWHLLQSKKVDFTLLNSFSVCSTTYLCKSTLNSLCLYRAQLHHIYCG